MSECGMPANVGSNEGLGVCVLVHGRVVAWFAEFDSPAELWCTANHFGGWTTWAASAPVPRPLTQAQIDRVETAADELLGNLRVE